MINVKKRESNLNFNTVNIRFDYVKILLNIILHSSVAFFFHFNKLMKMIA